MFAVSKISSSTRHGFRRFMAVFAGPQILAFLPATALAAYWLGGELALIAVTIAMPIIVFYAGAFDAPKRNNLPRRSTYADLMNGPEFEDLASRILATAQAGNDPTVCLLVELETAGPVHGLFGDAAIQHLRDQLLLRLRGGLRRHDVSVRIGDNRFGIVLEPDERLTLDAALQTAGRIQSLLEEPVAFDKRTLYPTVSVGFCVSTRLAQKATGRDLVSAALIALDEAVLNGPSALRAYSEKLKKQELRRHDLIKQVPQAIEKGQIQPWFQPQVSTETGKISGFEALARWVHPKLGIIPPAEFIPSLEAAGVMQQLGGRMVAMGLAALARWDAQGLDIPYVSVNLSSVELRDPHLVDVLKWELDAADMKPERLRIEILETVIADGPDGIISRNLRALSALGCGIDLDDFGTGQASLGMLRNFNVRRIKIDRSFISRIDRDAEQQRLVAAIIGMADQLGLRTVAEGVESQSEHALLAQLGCNEVQGFGIARPMAADLVPDWVRNHRQQMPSLPQIRRKSG